MGMCHFPNGLLAERQLHSASLIQRMDLDQAFNKSKRLHSGGDNSNTT